MTTGKGVLADLRVLELGGIGPIPHCGMLLADMGADVIRVDRPVESGGTDHASQNLLQRGRRSIALDLKAPAGHSTALRLVAKSDVLIEGFRPGVAEKLGLGPETCRAQNPGLIYGRMTGWGQDGPLSQAAGHDINYIALTGALHAVGPRGGDPVIPLNLIGDFGGGALYLALGVCAALVERQRSGLGQVVDAAMVDGASSLMTLFFGWQASGQWTDERGSNLLDGGVPWYAVYKTADAKYVSIGALESRFFAELVARLDLDPAFIERRDDPKSWPAIRAALDEVFATKTRDQWCKVLEGTDVCFAPVLGIEEAPHHPHNVARRTFVETGGVRQPAPAPRFSRTPSHIKHPPPQPASHTREILLELGLSESQIAALYAAEVVADSG